MKKSIYLLGMAVAALSSCSQSDVVEMPENRAIEFSSFVNNNTRAGEVTKANFSKFAVYGSYNNTTWVPVYQNITVNGSANANWKPEKLAYWEPSKSYAFAAYSNGNDVLANDNVTFDPATVKLEFTNYEAGANDLVAATNDDITTKADVTNQTAVQLGFNHMLSKVKFTFKTEASDNYKMTVNSLTITQAITTGNGSYEDGTVGAWTGDADGTYTYTVTDLTDFAATGEHSTIMYLIPQNNATLSATISVTATDGGTLNATKTFTVPVKYTPASESAAGTANEWTAGYAYNYIATINPDDVSDTTKEITFSTSVEDWIPANDQNWNNKPQP